MHFIQKHASQPRPSGVLKRGEGKILVLKILLLDENGHFYHFSQKMSIQNFLQDFANSMSRPRAWILKNILKSFHQIFRQLNRHYRGLNQACEVRSCSNETDPPLTATLITSTDFLSPFLHTLKSSFHSQNKH